VELVGIGEIFSAFSANHLIAVHYYTITKSHDGSVLGVVIHGTGPSDNYQAIFFSV